MLMVEMRIFMKTDNSVWLKIGLTYFIILMVLYIPIVLFEIFPSNYTYEDLGDTLVVEHGVFSKEQYIFEINEQNEQQIAILKFYIDSVHSLVNLGVPLLSFIIAGFLFQFSKKFKMMKGIETSRKRVVALLLITMVILLWFIGEFLHRRGNVIESLVGLM